MGPGNGLVDNRTYDLQGRLTTQTLGSLDTRNYVYDKNGNILQRNTTPQVGLYTYDREDQLTSDAQNGGIPSLFTYDLNHNRLSKAKQDNSEQNKYDYSSLTNRLLSVETAITGNDPLPAEPSFTRTYNNANRWFELHEAGVKKADYIYNSQGQRTRKTLYNPDGSTASITIYHYNLDGQLIAETTETGAALKDYVWAGQNPVAQIDKQVANDEVNYLHTDHLATPRFATNQSDTIVWRWDGEAFGETEANEDPDGNATPTTVNLRFPGQYYDAESKLHYNYFRDYDPSIGRYIQSDPIGLGGGINTYGYVGGNPLMYSDSLGLITSGEAGAIGSAIGGAIGGAINGALTGASAGAPGGVPGVVGGAIGGGIVGGAVGGATGLASGAASASLGTGGATGAGLVTGGLVGGAAGLAGEAAGAVIPGPGGAIASGTIGGALGGVRGGGATVVGGAIGGAIGGIISAALCYASAECRNETGCD